MSRKIPSKREITEACAAQGIVVQKGHRLLNDVQNAYRKIEERGGSDARRALVLEYDKMNRKTLENKATKLGFELSAHNEWRFDVTPAYRARWRLRRNGSQEQRHTSYFRTLHDVDSRLDIEQALKEAQF